MPTFPSSGRKLGPPPRLVERVRVLLGLDIIDVVVEIQKLLIVVEMLSTCLCLLLRGNM